MEIAEAIRIPRQGWLTCRGLDSSLAKTKVIPSMMPARAPTLKAAAAVRARVIPQGHLPRRTEPILKMGARFLAVVHGADIGELVDLTGEVLQDRRVGMIQHGNRCGRASISSSPRRSWFRGHRCLAGTSRRIEAYTHSDLSFWDGSQLYLRAWAGSQ